VTQSVSWKPDRTVGGPFRGGRTLAVGETTVTVEVMAEMNVVRTYEISKALRPGALVNEAIALRLINPGAAVEDYVFSEVLGTRYAGGVPASESGGPNWGAIPYAWTNEDPAWWRE
jgi:hypothetical protein